MQACMLECVLMGLNGFDEVFSHLVILSHFEGIPDGFADQIFGKRRKVTDNARFRIGVPRTQNGVDFIFLLRELFHPNSGSRIDR